MHAAANQFFELALGRCTATRGPSTSSWATASWRSLALPLPMRITPGVPCWLPWASAARSTPGPNPLAAGGAALRVRMGLNTGLVVVGAIGDNLRMDYTAVGDTTNVAARLQQEADSGQILISETTQRLVSGLL